MAEMVLKYPDELVAASGKSRETVEQELRFQFAVRMHQIGEFSLGQAAAAAGMKKLQFADELGKRRIPLINWDDEEIAAELKAIRAYHRR